MPAASHIEKEGSFTNTQRLVQWRDKALDPPGDARSELWFMHHLAKRVKAHYAGSTRERDWPIVQPALGLPGARRACASPTSRTCSRRSTATTSRRASPSARLRELEADGSTACGCWIYSGIYKDGVNQARRRDPGDIDAEGGWRLARVGVGVAGQPAHPLQPRLAPTRRAGRGPSASSYVWWDEEQGKLDGLRRPRLPRRQAPGLPRAGGRARAWTRSAATTRSS